jgi:hypothetical protein
MTRLMWRKLWRDLLYVAWLASSTRLITHQARLVLALDGHPDQQDEKLLLAKMALASQTLRRSYPKESG